MKGFRMYLPHERKHPSRCFHERSICGWQYCYRVASGNAGGTNDAAFASRAAVVEADFRKATSDDEHLPFGKMIGSTAGVKGDVSTEGAYAGATTIGNVTSGDAGGASDAAFASRAASVEADFCKATRDDQRLPFWPIPEVGGLFELFMAIGNRGLPTNLESKTCGSGYLDSLGTYFWIDSWE